MTDLVELLMSQKTLPWPLFVNQGFYTPKCLFLIVGFENGSCQFFFSLSRSRSKVKGHGFRIYRINDYIIIYDGYSLNIWSKLGNNFSKHLTAILDTTFKWPWHPYLKGQGHLARICPKYIHKLWYKRAHALYSNR